MFPGRGAAVNDKLPMLLVPLAIRTAAIARKPVTGMNHTRVTALPWEVAGAGGIDRIPGRSRRAVAASGFLLVFA